MGEDSTNATVLDLAHGNNLASRDLAHQVVRVIAGKSDDSVWSTGVNGSVAHVMMKPTPGERLAQRVSIGQQIFYLCPLLRHTVQTFHSLSNMVFKAAYIVYLVPTVLTINWV